MQQSIICNPRKTTKQIKILSTLGGKQIMPCDAVSIYTWFQHHKLDLDMCTKAYYIVTQIGGPNVLLNNLFIYKCEYTLWEKKRHATPRQKHELNIWVILKSWDRMGGKFQRLQQHGHVQGR